MAVEKNRTVTELEEEREEREEEIIELRSDIELMQTERDETRNKIAFYRDRKQLLEKEVKLDIEPANKLHSVNSKLVELNSDLEVLKKEISLLSIKLNRARQKSQKIAESMFSEEMLFRETPGTGQTYLAPKSGQVARIYKESSEFALRSEPVMSIRVQRPKVRIQAIFREQHIEHLSIGDEVTITFDNGEESKGNIVDLKEENQDMIDDEDLSELSNRYIVEIEPIDDKARKVWESLSHLGVTVTKSIYSL
jgi:multidrug resistance efflux pump